VNDASADPQQELPPGLPRPRKRRGGSVAAQKWSRIIHAYTSMISLLVVLFFAVTGVTLNHPDWTFGTTDTRQTVAGTLPDNWKAGNEVDWFVVSEHLRSTESVKGSLAEKEGDTSSASITYKGPAYQADTFINSDGTYELTIEKQGVVAVINDLHKGRNTRQSWKWLIDVSGIFLALVSITGLVLQFFIRKRRRSALASAVAGGLLLAFLTWLAIS
jgi:uncharacterized protein